MTFKIVSTDAISPQIALAFDRYGHVGAEEAKALKAFGFGLGWLYADVVTVDDILNVTSNGMALGFVLTGLGRNTVPTAEIGSNMGMGASRRLRGLGVPSGLSIPIDLEGEGRLVQDWIAFANGAADGIKSMGDKPGFYIGEGLGLTSDELFALRGLPYWKGMSRVEDAKKNLAEPKCGWAMVQQYPDDRIIGGIQVDVSVVGKDYWNRSFDVLVST